MARKIKWVASDYAYDIVDELLASDGGLSRAAESALREARKICVGERDILASAYYAGDRVDADYYRDAIRLIDNELTRHRAFLKRQGDMFAIAA